MKFESEDTSWKRSALPPPVDPSRFRAGSRDGENSLSYGSRSHQSIPAMLLQRAAVAPNAIAYDYEEGAKRCSITWSEFLRRADRLARGLILHGLRMGDHVGILALTGLDWELSHHAALLSGGVVVGLEPHDSAERLQWIADHAELQALIVGDESLLAKLGAARARLRLVVLLQKSGETRDTRLISWRQLEAGGHDGISLPQVLPEAFATLIYTSGTTGRPKGIRYRHEQVTLAVDTLTRAYPLIDAGSRFVCWLPLSNLFQRIMNLAAMSVGGTIYLVRDPLSVLEALPSARPHIFIGVPRFYEKLYTGMRLSIERRPALLRWLIQISIRLGARIAKHRENKTTPSLPESVMHGLVDRLILRRLRSVLGGYIRFMITGSAPTPVRILDFFHAIGLPLYEAYGLSENIVPIALNRPDQFRIGTVGRPLEENVLRLAEDGELLIQGPGVFAGYYRNDESTLFTADSYYQTGDYARFDEGGFLQLVGRKSEIIKTSTGRRISPVAIESRLEELTYVDRAVVAGTGRKCVSAILALSAIDEIPPSSLGIKSREAYLTLEQAKSVVTAAEHLAASLPEHERPAGYVLLCRALSVQEGELTPNLKLKRAAVEKKFERHLDSLYERIEARQQKEGVVFIVARETSDAV